MLWYIRVRRWLCFMHWKWLFFYILKMFSTLKSYFVLHFQLSVIHGHIMSKLSMMQTYCVYSTNFMRNSIYLEKYNNCIFKQTFTVVASHSFISQVWTYIILFYHVLSNLCFYLKSSARDIFCALQYDSQACIITLRNMWVMFFTLRSAIIVHLTTVSDNLVGIKTWATWC